MIFNETFLERFACLFGSLFFVFTFIITIARTSLSTSVASADPIRWQCSSVKTGSVPTCQRYLHGDDGSDCDSITDCDLSGDCNSFVGTFVSAFFRVYWATRRRCQDAKMRTYSRFGTNCFSAAQRAARLRVTEMAAAM